MKPSASLLTSDQRAESSVLDRLATAVSVVCVPPILAVPLVILSAQHTPAGADPSLASLMLIMAVGILPAVFVAACYRLGYVSSLSVSVRSERRGPALFTACCALAAYSILAFHGAPAVLLSLSAALSFQLAGLALITNWWRVSYHTASMSGLAFAAQALEGPTLGIPLLLRAALVGWSRVRLGRHTPVEVGMGLLASLPLLWWPWAS